MSRVESEIILSYYYYVSYRKSLDSLSDSSLETVIGGRIFVADYGGTGNGKRHDRRRFREEIARSCVAWSIRANDDNDNHINDDNAGPARNNRGYKIWFQSGKSASIWFYANYSYVVTLLDDT